MDIFSKPVGRNPEREPRPRRGSSRRVVGEKTAGLNSPHFFCADDGYYSKDSPRTFLGYICSIASRYFRPSFLSMSRISSSATLLQIYWSAPME